MDRERDREIAREVGHHRGEHDVSIPERQARAMESIAESLRVLVDLTDRAETA